MDYQPTQKKNEKYSKKVTHEDGYLPSRPSSGRNSVACSDAGPEFRSVSMIAGNASLKNFRNQPLKGPMDIDKGYGFQELKSIEGYGLQKHSEYRDIPNLKQKAMTNPMEIESNRQINPNEIPNPPKFRPILPKRTWENPKLKPIPNYYPLESSNRVLNEHEFELSEVTSNLSEAFRVLGIQTKYFESPAGAALLTPELVEIYLYLWKKGNGQICIEVQRRRGDSVTFYRYARQILEAASGDFDVSEYTDFSSSHYLRAAEKLLKTEMTNSSKEREESLMSIELAANLLQKERLDARILGMESLCILTDPRKTCLNTAILVSRAVILGRHSGEDHYACRLIHEFVLNIVQKRCMSDEDSLLEDMIVDYDSDDDEDYFMEDEERDAQKPSEYFETVQTCINHGLRILSNAWEVLTTFESLETEPEKTSTGQLSSSATLVDTFREISYAITHEDILTTLLMEVFRAESKAHNACLAGKCLKIMCQSSITARASTKNLHGLQYAAHAEEIGKVTNARLQEVFGELRQILER